MIYKDINSKQCLKYIFFIASYSLTPLCNGENWARFTNFNFLFPKSFTLDKDMLNLQTTVRPALFMKPNNQLNLESCKYSLRLFVGGIIVIF